MRDNRRRGQAIRTRGWKWIDGRLFDLAADPGEHTDVADRHPDVARRLEGALGELAGSPRTPAAGTVILDPETLEQLRALGYVD